VLQDEVYLAGEQLANILQEQTRACTQGEVAVKNCNVEYRFVARDILRRREIGSFS
jgi:hypothetical protein